MVSLARRGAAARREDAAETQRLAALWERELALREQGYRVVAGVDEAGRGCLAGPVVAAAVVLPPGIFIEALDDSKRLSPRQREEIYGVIRLMARAIGVGEVSPARIDEVNILQATYLAMRQAVFNLGLRPEHLVVDALRIPGLDCPQSPIIHGDALCASIAAASIVAKVTRDSRMRELDRLYPQYGFGDNKGYCTLDHRRALTRHGPCPIHRRSFRWPAVES